MTVYINSHGNIDAKCFIESILQRVKKQPIFKSFVVKSSYDELSVSLSKHYTIDFELLDDGGK